MKEWTQGEVFEWLQTACQLPQEEAQKFLTEEINGGALRSLGGKKLARPSVGISLGPAMMVVKHAQKFAGQPLFDCRHEHPNL